MRGRSAHLFPSRWIQGAAGIILTSIGAKVGLGFPEWYDAGKVVVEKNNIDFPTLMVIQFYLMGWAEVSSCVDGGAWMGVLAWRLRLWSWLWPRISTRVGGRRVEWRRQNTRPVPWTRMWASFIPDLNPHTASGVALCLCPRWCYALVQDESPNFMDADL